MVIIADGRYELPDNLYYSHQHVFLDKEKKLLGIDQLGFAYLKNPKELKILAEKEIKIGEPMVVVSTDHGITTLESPVKGIVKNINEDALKDMENDTYSKGYIIEMESIEEVNSNLISGKAQIEKWAKFESKSLLYGQYVFKIIEIGDSTVGKTAIKVRFTDDYFKKDLKTTLGVDFGSKDLNIEYITEDVLFLGTHRFTAKMNLWDAAGQAHYEKIRGIYYRGAKGALLVFDVNNPVSFQNLDMWINELEENIGRKIPVLLIGNKIDLPRKVSKAEALEYAKKNGFLYSECSAKTGEGVNQSFKKLAIEIYKKEENL
jgi:small GTP-binding protein